VADIRGKNRERIVEKYFSSDMRLDIRSTRVLELEYFNPGITEKEIAKIMGCGPKAISEIRRKEVYKRKLADLMKTSLQLLDEVQPSVVRFLKSKMDDENESTRVRMDAAKVLFQGTMEKLRHEMKKEINEMAKDAVHKHVVKVQIEDARTIVDERMAIEDKSEDGKIIEGVVTSVKTQQDEEDDEK